MVVKVMPGQAKDGGYYIKKNIHITRKELEVMALIGNGITIEEAANKMGTSSQTIKNHLYKLAKKLNARSRSHALTILMEHEMLKIMPLLDRELLTEEKPRSGYLWCLHCERTYKYGKFRLVKVKPFIVNHVRYEPDYQMCPYEDCDGDTVLDAWNWDDIRKEHPEYPKIPKHGVKYPMY